jgi:pimeloyl-ACP methyl ester carboxylesterase
MVDMEAGVNHGFDGIIVQSFGHNPAPAFATFPSALEPAQLEPRFASLPPGYYTTRPAIAPLEPTSPRATFFFQPAGQYDPAVVATEEAGKSTMTDAEVPTFPPAFAFSQLVTVPVLSILGADDSFFCSSEACPESAEEAASYPNASSFEAHLIPAVGHDMDLEFNGKPLVFPAILDWLTRKF